MLERAAAVTWRLLVLAAGLIALAIALSRLVLVVLPVVVALLVATALVPPVYWLRHKGWPALLATWVVLLLSIGLLAGMVVLIAPGVQEQVGEIGTSVTEGVDDVEQWLQDGPLSLSQGEIDQYLQQGLDAVRGRAENIAGSAVTGITLAGEIIAGILLTFVLVFFFVKDGERMWAWIIDLVPGRRRQFAHNLGRRAWITLGAYLRGTAIVGLVDATLIGVGLFVIGVPLVFPLALLTFVGAFFPLVGATLAGLVAVLVALVSGGVVDAALVLAVVIGVQQVEGDVLAPLVMGRAVSLHPVVILVALTAGSVLYGVIGAFVAVPVTAVAVSVGTEIRRERGEDVGDSVEDLTGSAAAPSAPDAEPPPSPHEADAAEEG